MEKEPQTDSFTTVKVKDYPPVHADIYGNEPPPVSITSLRESFKKLYTENGVNWYENGVKIWSVFN